jgi:hypothetical protein
MITHYDMLTGEVIEEEAPDRPHTAATQPDMAAEPRLLTVQEANAVQKPAPRLPADAATLPVDTLIARWS